METYTDDMRELQLHGHRNKYVLSVTCSVVETVKVWKKKPKSLKFTMS